MKETLECEYEITLTLDKDESGETAYLEATGDLGRIVKDPQKELYRVRAACEFALHHDCSDWEPDPDSPTHGWIHSTLNKAGCHLRKKTGKENS